MFSGRGESRIRVLKFGGTSVGTVDGLRSAVRITRRDANACRPVVVVSAAAGVTDGLVRAAEGAPHSPPSAEQWADRIGTRYRRLAAATLRNESLRVRYESTLQARVADLRRALTGRVPSESAARDAVLSVGERLMAPLFAGLLADAGERARAVDATTLICTDATYGAAVVDRPATRAQVREWHAAWDGGIPIITGFIGSTPEGVTTTLGRGGSDYSAALIARGLGAERMERWTDVAGLYTSDPAEHDDVQRLARISIARARAWAKEGRLGLHARTLDPLAATGIPLHVRCTRRPEAAGTRVVPSGAEVEL